MKNKKIPLSVFLVLVLLLIFNTKYISATKGTGILYVYETKAYNELVPQSKDGFYEVYPGQTIYIQIKNIEEELGSPIEVYVSYKDSGERTFLGTFDVKITPDGTRYVGDSINPISWTVPLEAEVCNTYVVQYKKPNPNPTYIASSPELQRVAHLHITPENPLGTLGVISAILASFAVYHVIKNRKITPAFKF